MEFTTDVVDRLSPHERRAVRELAGRVAERDGAPPLSDESLVALAAPATHVLMRRDGTVQAYAQLRDGTAELAAEADLEPLLDQIERLSARLVWAHGRRSPVGPALEARRYRMVRELWQLRRPLADLRDAPVPPGVTLRAFRPGRDEDAWVAVNAAAFATHPEQGRMRRADLEARMGEPWFDPAGLLMAWAGDDLVGFHWTKVHAGTPLGEVYVLAVAPAAQGQRLGAALLWAGLHHLAAAGCDTVLLYVDGDNAAAMALYEKAGFERYDLDAQYARR